jgi:hypothetical protein
MTKTVWTLETHLGTQFWQRLQLGYILFSPWGLVAIRDACVCAWPHGKAEVRQIVGDGVIWRDQESALQGPDDDVVVFVA